MAHTHSLMALVVVGGVAASMAIGSQPAKSAGSAGVVRLADASIDMMITGPVPSGVVMPGQIKTCTADCQNERLSYWRKRIRN